MAQHNDFNTWKDAVILRKKKWSELPKEWSEDERAKIRLHAVSAWTEKPDLVGRIIKNGVVSASSGVNCEQIIGELTLPLAAVGPIHIQTDGDTQKYFVPLATTEGALVASVQRGVKAIGLSGGIYALVEDVGATRAPVFVVDSLKQGQQVVHWIKQHKSFLKKVVEKTSNHIELLDIVHTLVGKNLFLRLRFNTSQAMGMNMVTIASQAMVEVIEQKCGISCVSLSGNACVDKKPAWVNAVLGRGMRVNAEVVVPGAVVRDVLKTTPEKIVDVVLRKDYLGSAISGSMGFNGHYANMISALYLATGQDLAHVVEGSLGITTAEVVGDDLYFSINLPDIMVGTVGGGTHLPVQRAALNMMNLGYGVSGEKEEFGKIIGSVVLAGELSLTAALASHHLARAHQTLGRKKRA